MANFLCFFLSINVGVDLLSILLKHFQLILVVNQSIFLTFLLLDFSGGAFLRPPHWVCMV